MTNTFASEMFMDELAQGAASPRCSSCLRELADERAKAVLQTAAERPAGQARPSPQTAGQRARQKTGAASPSSSTTRTEAYVAAVAEVEVNQADGQVWVKRVVVAHDCGLIINLHGLRNQIEGTCNPRPRAEPSRKKLSSTTLGKRAGSEYVLSDSQVSRNPRGRG